MTKGIALTSYNEADHPRANDGRWTEAAHAEPVLDIRTAPTDRAAALTKELNRLDTNIPKALDACGSVDVLRESYDDFFAAGKAQRTRDDALAVFRAELPELDEARRDHWVEMIGHAVEVEMKHREDREYVLHPDHDHELLIDVDDYSGDDALVDEGNDHNIEAWEILANNAMAHALDENLAAATARATASKPDDRAAA